MKNDEFDITGYQFIITFKTSKSDTDDYAVLIKRFTAPNNVYSRAGKVFLPFESTDTSRFTPGTYYYDIQFTVDLCVTTYIQGNFQVIQDVTYG